MKHLICFLLSLVLVLSVLVSCAVNAPENGEDRQDETPHEQNGEQNNEQNDEQNDKQNNEQNDEQNDNRDEEQTDPDIEPMVDTGNGKQTDLMEGFTSTLISFDPVQLEGENAVAVADFAVRLLKNSLDGKRNTLVSPVSVLYALAMTANGADGETLSQMEKALGFDIDSLNEYLRSYNDSLSNDKRCKLSIANSIWFTNDELFKVENGFLQANADYYGADIYKAPFNGETLKNINSWVEDNTDGMIKDILSNIPEDAIMYLINAIAFDAEWQNIYTEYQIYDGIFTTEDGKKRDVEMMNSTENSYLDDGNATGFIKYYSGSKYAFAALLPDEGISIDEYVGTLTGEGLSQTLDGAKSVKVIATMPKFESEFDTEMSGVLCDMGMNLAFDRNYADFSRLGSYPNHNICINRVIHKTYISVDGLGTKAGAATAVEMIKATSAGPSIEETKEVVLDRPFVYMIIDTQANLPLFIGTTLDIE